MKILAICNGGNNRSGGFALVYKSLNGAYKGSTLRNDCKYEAIAIGAHLSNKDTIKMLIDWADKVIILTEVQDSINELKEMAKEKSIVYNIGIDRFGSNSHPELQQIAMKIIEEYNLK